LYGWVVGDSGTIVHTTNSGADWVLQNSGIESYPFDDIYFINRNSGWVVCNDYLFQGSIILKTTNGGLNWLFSRFPDTSYFVTAIHFRDSLTGFIGGFNGSIYKTTNGGANWFLTSDDTSGCFYLVKKNDFVFLDNQTGFACGGIFDFQGIIWKTTDGGMVWKSFCLSPEPMQEIKSTGQNRIAAMGGDYEFGGMSVQTTNLGSNWIYENIGCFGNVSGFDFRTPSEVWAALSFSGYIALNIDSMQPNSFWTCIPGPDNQWIYDIKFESPTKGWCVGSNGSIFRYNTAIIGINGSSNTLIKEFKLHQNYPNPFNPETFIGYEVPLASEIKITIYDVLGKIVRIFDEGVKLPGYYDLKFEGGNLSSGIYYYTLQSGSFYIAKKMVLLK
jgi:photosystem II stability/assembly factor-like uncharacterized protein